MIQTHARLCRRILDTAILCDVLFIFLRGVRYLSFFFFTVVVISLLGTVWYDFENRVQTSGVEMRLRILCLNFMVFRPQTPRMSNFECSWVCFQFLLTRYLTLFFQYISASWDKTVRIWNAYKKSEFLGLCQLISFVTTGRPMYLGTLQLRLKKKGKKKRRVTFYFMVNFSSQKACERDDRLSWLKQW